MPDPSVVCPRRVSSERDETRTMPLADTPHLDSPSAHLANYRPLRAGVLGVRNSRAALEGVGPHSLESIIAIRYGCGPGYGYRPMYVYGPL
jgi:hypothetical protein